MNMFWAYVAVVLAVCSAEFSNNTEYLGKENFENGKIAEDASKYRPCKVYETNCIRKFLAERSNCKIRYGPVPDPLFRAESNLYYPTFDMAAHQIGLYYKKFRGYVEEFFVDTLTDQVVLQIRFNDFYLESTVDKYVFYRDGKEPAVTTSNSNALFPMISINVVFPNSKQIDLAQAEVTGTADVLPILYLNPTAAIHPDPTIAKRFALFVAGAKIVVAEAFLTASQFVAASYIQYNLCDFGLKVE